MWVYFKTPKHQSMPAQVQRLRKPCLLSDARALQEKKQESRLSSFGGRPGNSSVASLVIKNRNLVYVEPRGGFDTKHQSITMLRKPP